MTEVSVKKEKIKTMFYFTNEWWNQYFFSEHDPPNAKSADELDRIYLQRKRFLYESFGMFGQGEEHPLPDGKYVNMFVKWGMDVIPYILGCKLSAKEAGGYHVSPLSRDEISGLKPVDVAGTVFAEWLIKRKEFLERRYGSADIVLLLETSLNAASRMRGEEFYIDLGLDKPFAKHLLDVILQTTLMAYRFFTQVFPMPDVNLTNCTINHISAEMYEEMFLDNDIYLAENTRDLFPEKKNHVLLHNCDLPADRFLEYYARIPYVYQFQASYKTDMEKYMQYMQDIPFCALVNPVSMIQMRTEELKEMMGQKTNDGVREWVFWGIDPLCGIEKVQTLMQAAKDACEANGFEAELETIPFNFDELEWSFPGWQGKEIYSIDGVDKLAVDIN